jgi:ATP-dependent helicase YprA (DUF1998 family)
MEIQIRWYNRFIIEAEDLARDTLDHAPFQVVDIRKVLWEEFVPYKIQTRAWTTIILDDSFLLLGSGTGSGKTEAIVWGMLDRLLAKRTTHCLIMYPMKALAQDQETRLRHQCSELDLTIQRYDSSVSAKAKAMIRENPGEILIITPDTLMGSIVGTHNERWYNHLTKPQMIWVDEFHATGGTLGTALIYLIRVLHHCNRLLRVFLTSATLPNIHELARLLPHTTTVLEGKSIHGTIRFHVGPIEVFREIMDLVLLDEGQFLVFIENKQEIERLMRINAQFSPLLDRYHADLPDDERQLILTKFERREIKGLLCTSAISLGVDISSVKTIILYRFPRSFALLFQEMGRGMRTFEATGNVYLLLDETKMADNYYRRHLQELIADIHAYRVEPMVIDLLNEWILRGMVLFAIKLGMNRQQDLIQGFQEAHRIGKLEQILTWLLIKGFVSKSKGEFSYLDEYANDFLLEFLLNLRPGFPKFQIMTRENEKEMVLGFIGAEDIPFRACKGNYIFREGGSYLVNGINYNKRILQVVAKAKRCISKNIVSTTVNMCDELKFKAIGEVEIRLANFKVQVKPARLRNYQIITPYYELLDTEEDPGEYLGNYVLDFKTRGLVLKFSDDSEDPPSRMALYQLSKVLLKTAVLLIDISEGEVDCYQNHDQGLCYFLDRSCPTGVSEQLYEKLEFLLRKTQQIVENCGCERGCDRCVIPVESNFLNPNVGSEDPYRKDELLSLLKRCLGESGNSG